MVEQGPEVALFEFLDALQRQARAAKEETVEDLFAVLLVGKREELQRVLGRLRSLVALFSPSLLHVYRMVTALLVHPVFGEPAPGRPPVLEDVDPPIRQAVVVEVRFQVRHDGLDRNKVGSLGNVGRPRV